MGRTWGVCVKPWRSFTCPGANTSHLVQGHCVRESSLERQVSGVRPESSFPEQTVPTMNDTDLPLLSYSQSTKMCSCLQVTRRARALISRQEPGEAPISCTFWRMRKRQADEEKGLGWGHKYKPRHWGMKQHGLVMKHFSISGGWGPDKRCGEKRQVRQARPGLPLSCQRIGAQVKD